MRICLSDNEIKSGGNGTNGNSASFGGAHPGMLLAAEFGEMIYQGKVVQYILRPKM